MIFREFDSTPTSVLRSLLMALAVMWMLLPEQAVALSNSAETPFVPFSGCVDFGFTEVSSASSMSGGRSAQTFLRSASFSAASFSPASFSPISPVSMAVSQVEEDLAELRAAFTPCETEDRDADPQYNICFEGNPAPISTLPHLLAGLQAERASWIVMKTVAEYSETLARDYERVIFGADGQGIASGGAERKAPPANRGATCSPSGDLCSALPGMPGHVDLSSVTPLLVLNAGLSVPPAPLSEGLEREQELWARLRVGPAAEHRLRVDQPPIRFGDNA